MTAKLTQTKTKEKTKKTAKRTSNFELVASGKCPHCEASLGDEVDAETTNSYNAPIRQRSSVVEQRTHKPLVVGSNPSAATFNYLSTES